jgi:hypothetical protein
MHTLVWRYRPGLPFACATAYITPPAPYPQCADRAWVDELTLPALVVASTTTLGASADPTTTGQSVTFTANVTGSSGPGSGSVTFNDGGTPIGGCTSVSLVAGLANCTTSALAAGIHAITAVYGGSSAYSGSTSAAVTQAVSGGPLLLTASPTALPFGGQSMNTTSPALDVVITNSSGSAVTPTSITAPSGFAIASNGCTAAIAPSATCTVSLTLTPASEGALTGILTVSYAGGGPTYVVLTGTGERSLVTHYYRSILRRDPDAGGKAFWESEATRMAGLGANINETWYAMAMSFYFSPEYAALQRDDAGFVTDLYNTFFNRAPDAGGISFWGSQLAAGMPREVLLAQFMFSTEFANFTQAIFGTTTTRAEVNAVTDFYRGLLSRLPDSAGFNFWVGQFQAAQCQGSTQVVTQVNAISSAYITSAEYAARNRTNAQYVGDLYNAFLRRGGDLTGVQFWIGQLDTSAQSREQLRQAFVASTEFQNRVSGILAQGCIH